jgi:hypothetical protein
MRVGFRVALLFVVVFCAPILTADHFRAECPLSLVDSTPPATGFDVSPHGVFRNGSLLHVLRGNILTTYNINDLGDLSIAREDFIQSLAGRETNAGVAFGAGGYMFVSSEAGLEIFDLRNVRAPAAGGNAPILVVRRAGLHYRRLAINGTKLAGLYPLYDMPCYPVPDILKPCATKIDLFNITTINNPTFAGSITPNVFDEIGFNDIVFNFGLLLAVGDGGLSVYNVANPAAPARLSFDGSIPGRWFISNNNDFVGVGTDRIIRIFRFNPLFALFDAARILSIPSYLEIERSNPIRFHPQAFYDEANARLITLIEEINPINLQPARTIAFDVFDFTVPQFEGSVERIYEDVTMTMPDEVKYNPTAAGSSVFVIGAQSGLQEWGACNRVTGRIELDSVNYLTCGGAEIHGWVTGTQKIMAVELFLDNTSLGSATIGQIARNDVSSTTPAFTWRITANLDTTAAGEHLLRAIGTDVLGQRRQFAFKRIYFPGTPNNCIVPKRRAVR